MPTDRFDLSSPSAASSPVVPCIALAGALALALYVAGRLRQGAHRGRQQREWRERFAARAPDALEPGLATLAGTVQMDGAAGVALRARARAKGWYLDLGDGAGWHLGDGAPRIETRPFTLALNGSGARVGVLTDAQTVLLDWPVPAGIPPSEDVLELSLGAGQRVVVDGLLAPRDPEAATYRRDGNSLILRGHPGGRLVIEVEGFAHGLERERHSLRPISDGIVATVACAYLITLAIYAHDRSNAGAPERRWLGGDLWPTSESVLLAVAISVVVVVLGVAFTAIDGRRTVVRPLQSFSGRRR